MTTCTPHTASCSATKTAYGPPMVRSMTPQRRPSTAGVRILVWKQGQSGHGFARVSSPRANPHRRRRRQVSHKGGGILLPGPIMRARGKIFFGIGLFPAKKEAGL